MGVGIIVFIEATPDVPAKSHRFAVATTGAKDRGDDLKGPGQGFAIGLGRAPLVADVVDDAAHPDDGDREGQPALEGIDGALDLAQGHGLAS